ncbi:MAG TPA: hypothetical protein VFH68_12730 [Polyangia bacterium]|nr:hypothetical protein [Polyangia bacterium]
MTLTVRSAVQATLALGLVVVLATSGCGRSDLFSTRGHHGGGGGGALVDGGAGGGGGRAGNGGSADGGVDGPVPCQTRPEICGNGQDDNCNNLVDCQDPGCLGDRGCSHAGVEICNNALDDDDDGRVDCADPDCAGNIACRPVMGMEICDNRRDDNGDGLVDCGDPQCTTFAACLAVRCQADTDFGTLAAHGAKVLRTMTTLGSAASYVTCAPSGGHGRVGEFRIDQVTDVRLDFTQAGGSAHVVALFRAGANQACDQNSVFCLNPSQAPSATHTYAGLGAGVYRVIVQSYPNTEGTTTVTLSTGDVTQGKEICNNGVDDDKNGLVDCQDSACTSAPACAGSECVTDTGVGALVIGAPAKAVTVNSAGAIDRYHPYCSGSTPAPDRTIGFTLPEAGGVEVRYRAVGSYVFAIYRLPPAGLACDADLVTCFSPPSAVGDFALSDLPSGRYILLAKVAPRGGVPGPLDLQLSAFGNRMVETCTNGIDDDGNGLTDCDDPACAGVGMCLAAACSPNSTLMPFFVGTTQSVMVDTRGAPNQYQTVCGLGNGRERVIRLSLNDPMALGLQCTETGSHVFQLSRQVNPLDACNANTVSCGDPEVLPFGCNYAIPNLQPGTYNLIVEAFQAGTEGMVQLTLSGLRDDLREICDNGVDDDGDGASDCGDLKCVNQPNCARFACRADRSLGLLPLTGMPAQAIVDTTMGLDDQKATSCTSGAGGQDQVVNFQLPATADVTIQWAQLGNHALAIYPDGGSLLACDASPGLDCFATASMPSGSHKVRLPMGRYHLVVDADHAGAESGVLLYISAVPVPTP